MQQILGHLGPTGASAELCHPPREEPQSHTPASTASMIHTEGSTRVVLRGRPTIDGEPFDASAIAERVLALCRKHGAQCIARLRGPFSLALIDPEARHAVLAIDRMGIEALAWSFGPAGLVFGTSATAVAKRGSTTPELNRQAMFDFMLGHVVAAPDTAYADVHKLLPGTYLEMNGERVTSHRYWQPDFRRLETPDIATLRGEVLPTIRRAIERCAPSARTGAFLSGGLDSSTVTGLLSGLTDAPANAFSVAFGVDEYNELSYATIAAERFGCAHYVYEVRAEDVVKAIPRIAAAYDEPFGNSSAVPTFCCARLARQHGVDHLLAGDGGDELFGGNSRYVRHRVFELYARLPRWLRALILDPLAAKLDPESSPLPLRKFASYVRQAHVPLPERFESWNMIYREGAAAVFDSEFLESVDADYPLRRMREVWESCPSGDLLDRMLWYDWKLTLADNDLRKVSNMCELAGVRVSYPMLDEEVVDLSVRVPSAEKVSGTELRTFFKQAVRDFLPEEIIKKQKHGFGLPFGVWLKSYKPLQDIVYGSLESLRERRILSRVFVDRVAEEHRNGHASYYGYAIWDMVMLEQWLGLQAARSPAAAGQER